MSVTLDRSAVLALAGPSRYLGLRLDPAASGVNTGVYSPSLGPPYAPGVTFLADLPVAFDDTFTMPENTTLVVAASGVLANDFASTGTSLAAVVDQAAAHGSLTLAADGSFSYVPATNYHGTDTFRYHAAAGANASNSATVTLTVGHVNQPPVAADDAFATDEDTALTVSAPGVLANDSDPDADAISAVLASGPAHGSLTLNADGSFKYTPASNYNGADSFNYKASDGAALSGTATVSLTVTPVNDPPVATNDSYATNEDTPLTVAAPGVLGNDTDVDGDALVAVLVSGPTHGTLSLNADGSFVYTPSANYNGPDNFTYRAKDPSGALSNVATVGLVVNPVNDAPVAVNDAYSLNENNSIGVGRPGILGNDSDVDGDALSAVLVNGPTHGTLSLNSDGSFTYTPATNYRGADSFSYKASDGSLTSAAATVSFTITRINQPPTANPDTISVRENYGIGVSAPGVLGNDTDPNHEPLTAALVTGVSHGTLALATDGSYSYTPATNFSGTDSFTYTANDLVAASAPATVIITVTHLNQPPTAVGDAYSVNENESIGVGNPGVLANDTDPNSEPLTAVLATSPAHGRVTLNPNGSFTYSPDANFSVSDSFTYQATNGTLTSAPATVTLTVIHVNQPPVASGASITTAENAPMASRSSQTTRMATRSRTGSLPRRRMGRSPARPRISRTHPPRTTTAPTASPSRPATAASRATRRRSRSPSTTSTRRRWPRMTPTPRTRMSP